MIVKLSNHIAEIFEKKGYLDGEETEIMAYGLFSVISKLFYAVICIVCGLIFKLFFESCLFYLSFLFIKKYAGGFHASTERNCMIISTISIFLSVCCIYFCNIFSLLAKIVIIFAIISGIVITILSPLENKENPLSKKEKKTYKMNSLLRIAALIVVSFALILVSNKSAVLSICIAITLEGILLVVGKIKRYNEKNILLFLI